MSGAVLIAATSGGMSLKVTPSLVQGFGIGTVTTNAQLVGTVSGGTAPITYLWTTTDPGTFPLNSSVAATFFRRDGVASGDSYSTTATLTATDAAGQTAQGSGTVNITGF